MRRQFFGSVAMSSDRPPIVRSSRPDTNSRITEHPLTPTASAAIKRVDSLRSSAGETHVAEIEYVDQSTIRFGDLTFRWADVRAVSQRSNTSSSGTTIERLMCA